MLVVNSFDLWQKDAFFSAAEEVQESADKMESAYRLWLRERGESVTRSDLDELCRELQTALGTAKWQLDEFERAVRLSYGQRGDDNKVTRHSQFIAAIESQIFRVEAALKESFFEEGKKPFRWVNLDDEETDNFAAFLSGNFPTCQSPENEFVTQEEDSTNLNDVNTTDKNLKQCVIEVEEKVEEKEILCTSDDTVCQPDRKPNARRTWNSPNFGALKIVIADQDEERQQQLLPCIEATPKEKGSKPIFWKQRFPDFPQARCSALNMFNQLSGRVQKQLLQSPRQLQRGCSFQITLAFMLTIFLIVPFVLNLS